MSLHQRHVLRSETHLVCRLHWQQRQWWKPTRLFWLFATIFAAHYAKKWDRRWQKFLGSEKTDKHDRAMTSEAMRDLADRMVGTGMSMDRFMAPPESVVKARDAQVQGRGSNHTTITPGGGPSSTVS
jgi:hypothetical protein